MQEKEKMGWVRRKVQDAYVDLEQADMWAFHLHLEAKHRRALKEALEKAQEACFAMNEARLKLDLQGD